MTITQITTKLIKTYYEIHAAICTQNMCILFMKILTYSQIQPFTHSTNSKDHHNSREEASLVLEMVNLHILNLKLLEITALSTREELPPAIALVPCRLLLVHHLLQRLHHGVMSRVHEVRNRKPLPLRVHLHPMLHALVLIIAPNLHSTRHTHLTKNNSIITIIGKV